MTKKQWRRNLKHLGNKGYITHSMLLELWKEDDEIPEWYGKMLYSVPKEPAPLIFQCGSQSYHKFQELFKNYMEDGTNTNK